LYHFNNIKSVGDTFSSSYGSGAIGKPIAIWFYQPGAVSQGKKVCTLLFMLDVCIHIE